MEAIAAARLSEIAEKENLLPEIQIGFRKGRSTESALFLLTSQIEKIWKEGMVASLLSLDISGAYDRVLPEVLRKILIKRKIPVAVCTVLSYPSIGLGQDVEDRLVLAGEECQEV